MPPQVTEIRVPLSPRAVVDELVGPSESRSAGVFRLRALDGTGVVATIEPDGEGSVVTLRERHRFSPLFKAMVAGGIGIFVIFGLPFLSALLAGEGLVAGLRYAAPMLVWGAAWIVGCYYFGLNLTPAQRSNKALIQRIHARLRPHELGTGQDPHRIPARLDEIDVE